MQRWGWKKPAKVGFKTKKTKVFAHFISIKSYIYIYIYKLHAPTFADYYHYTYILSFHYEIASQLHLQNPTDSSTVEVAILG